MTRQNWGMKKIVVCSALFFLGSCGGDDSPTEPTTVTVADFLLAANGVTVLCTGANFGDTGEVGGVIYTARSEVQIDGLIDAENYEPLVTTCTSNVTRMTRMFLEVDDFNQDIGSWDVSSVTKMDLMFYEAESFNQDIGSWDVSSVTDLTFMFQDAESFNQNLSGWCVSHIASKPTAFDVGATSWVLPRPVWGTCPS